MLSASSLLPDSASSSSASSAVTRPLQRHSIYDVNLSAGRTIHRSSIGTLDSYLIEEYMSPSQADEVMWKVDGFVDYLSRNDPRMLFKIYGKSLEFPRDKAFYGNITVKNGVLVEPFYKYAKDTPSVKCWKGSVLEEVARDLDRTVGQPCNHVVVNQYQDGSDYVGAHHDKSATFHPGSCVLTLSLGGTRTLRLTCVKGAQQGETHDLELNHGSLFVLGPETNKYWKHSILKNNKQEHRRVSLTYRHIDAVRTSKIDENSSDPAHQM